MHFFLAQATQPAPSTEPSEAMAASKGGGGGWVPNVSGKGHPSGQPGGGGSAHWRQNLQALRMDYCPELTFAEFVGDLSAYGSGLTGVQKEAMESHRSHLSRCREHYCPGLQVLHY